MNSKTERLQSKNIFTPRSKTSDVEDNYKDKEKKELKETYSSFIIKLLEDPKYEKTKYKNRRKSNNLIINDSFKKNSKTKYLTTNNYNQKYKNNNITNNSKLFNKNNPIKTNLSYSYKIKKINDSSYINSKVPILQLSNINKTNFKTFKINSYHSKKRNCLEKTENKTQNKEKSQKLNIKKNILSRLYGYNKKYIFSKNNILKNKNLLELDKYQNNILKISQRKLSRDNLIKLYTDLQSIKTNANMIKPLPPINFPALVIHSFKEVDDREKHKKSISFENKKIKEMDEYEKELYDIKKSNVFKKSRYVNNKRLYKIFEILPEHVVEAVFKNKNKI